MSSRQFPEIEYVRQCLREEDGRLFWLERPVEHFSDERTWRRWNAKNSGREAGHFHKSDGRVFVSIDGCKFKRYQIVFALHRDRWARELDHKDRDRGNDRIGNLREATATQNQANRSIGINNRSGFKGVSWSARRKKWHAQIQVDSKMIYLGGFGSPEEAHGAYMEAARQHFGEFASDGKGSR